MTEEELKAIEDRANDPYKNIPVRMIKTSTNEMAIVFDAATLDGLSCDVPALIAEVRRLIPFDPKRKCECGHTVDEYEQPEKYAYCTVDKCDCSWC